MDGLAEQIVPARGAAQRATAHIAEQLADSHGPDADANPFREPAARTKSVKYRYTATGKHLSSPLKGTSSSPERKPKRPRLATATPAPAHAPKPAPAVATTSRKRKAVPRTEDRLGAMFASSPSPLSSLPSSPTVPTKDLPPSPALTPKDPLKPRPVAKTLSLHAFGAAKPKFDGLSQPLSPKRKQKKTKTDVDVWDIGNSVWVLVNQSGVLADQNARPSEHLVWWPAQVVQKQPLRVSMFGDFPSSSSANKGLCTIFDPSPSNVLSINDDGGTKRFSRTTFTSRPAADDAGPPPKKPRLDDPMEVRWEAAVQCMDKASTLEKDGLPALLSSYATTGGTFYDSLDDSDPDTSDLRQPLRKPTNATLKTPKVTESTRKLKSRASKASLKDDVPRSRAISLCPPDLTLQIPGELILALAPRTGGSYWPAQILKHVPSSKEKYRVKFLDDEEYEITRDRFFTSEEEGFVGCKLGEWESAVKTTDDPESGDEDEEFGTDAASALDDSALPPPPPADEFADLSVRAQLAYVKPVLQAILTKVYVPAREKHEAFMKGGSSRVALLKSAGVRGGMDARFVKAVQKVICEWVLGRSGVRPERLASENAVNGNGEVEGTARVSPQEAVPAEKSPEKTDGMESTGPQDVPTNGTLPLATLDKQAECAQVAEMAADVRPDSVSLPPTNHVSFSPAIQQALAPKSQLDLLAEVSQAVATEPSLLPSHPDVPKLKVQLLDIPSPDMSSQPSPLTPVPEEDQSLPLKRNTPILCEEFETLSGIEKLDYCLNILLPESVQQLLLWRSGERTSSTLLSPEEEKRLHQVGARKAAETDWVDDVMRLRVAQARLWGVGSDKKAEKTEVAQGGTRSRPRRMTVSKP